MSDGRLIDPRLLPSLSGLRRIYDRTCDVQRPGGATGATQHDNWGAPNLADNQYTTVISGLPCRFTPRNPTYRIETPQEVKTQDKIQETPQVHLAVAGYHPEIQLKDRIVMDNGTKYDIVFSESDSSRKTTRIMMQVVTI